MLSKSIHFVTLVSRSRFRLFQICFYFLRQFKLGLNFFLHLFLNRRCWPNVFFAFFGKLVWGLCTCGSKRHVEYSLKRLYDSRALFHVEFALNECSVLDCTRELNLQIVFGPSKGALTTNLAIFKISLVCERPRLEFTIARYLLI